MSPRKQNIDLTAMPEPNRQQRESYWQNFFKKYEILQSHCSELCDDVAVEDIGKAKSHKEVVKLDSVASNKTNGRQKVAETKCTNPVRNRARYDFRCNTNTETHVQKLEETNTRIKLSEKSSTVIKTETKDEISNEKLDSRRSTRNSNKSDAVHKSDNTKKRKVAYNTRTNKFLNRQPKRARYNLRCNTQTEYDDEECFSELEQTGIHLKQEKSPGKSNRFSKIEGKTNDKCEISYEKVISKKSKPNQRCSTSTEGNIIKDCAVTLVKLEETVKFGKHATVRIINPVKHENDKSNREKLSRRSVSAPRCSACFGTSAEECYPSSIKVENNAAYGQHRLPTKNTVGISGEFCEINSQKENRKRGRPRTKIKTDAENCYEPLIKVDNNTGTTESPRKRRKTATKRNTLVNVKVEANDTCEISNSNANKRKGRIPLKIKIEAKMENIDETENIKGNKWLRSSKRKEFKAEPNATPNELHFNITKPTKMNATPTKTPPVTYQKCIVHSFFKKELEKVYPILLENRRSHSRSSLGDCKHGRNLRRSKSVDYSEQSLLVPNPICPANNKKRNTSNKKVKSPRLVQQPPFQENQINVYQKCDETNLVDSICDTSHFNTTLLDFDALHTKSIIEEELKSNIGLLMVKRQYSLNSTDEDKENNYAFWHNALKNEIVKLRRRISIEKLEQYMLWYMRSWFAPENNMENYSKNENFFKTNTTIS